MHERRGRRGLAALVGLIWLSAACGGTERPLPPLPWSGATVLTAKEDSPLGVAAAGVHVVFTTGRHQVGDQAVRIAPLIPATPAASRVLAATPGGAIPNGPLVIDGDVAFVASGSGIVRVSLTTGEVSPVVGGR